MSEWFRKSSTGPRAAEPVPPTPGGTGGSGFGGVGGAPPGPEPAPGAGGGRGGRGGSGGSGGRGDAPTTAEPGRRGGASGGTAASTTGRGRRAIADVIPRVGGSQTPEERRFSQVYAEDRVGPMPYPNQASPDIAAARARVRSLVGDLLPGGVDEGTGAALDPLIASWASGWLSRIDSQHADHHAVVDRLVGGARRQLADAEASHERDRRALEIARTDYADARERLIEPGASPDGAAGPGGGGRPSDGRPSVLGRLGEQLVRRFGGDRPSPDHPGPAAPPAPSRPGAATGGAGRGGPPPRRPGPEERVGPSEPATRPVPIPPSTYGSTFDPVATAGGPGTSGTSGTSPDGPGEASDTGSHRAAPSPTPRGEGGTA